MSATPIRLLGSLEGVPLYRSSIAADPDDTKATAQTVRKMCEHIAGAVKDPATQAAAATALKRFGNVALSQARRRAWSAWWYAKHLVKFVSDDTLLASMLNEHDQRELLNPPPVLLRMSKPQGDCDDFTMLVCSLLKCLGVPFEIVTIAADPAEPSRWSHVYAVALVEDGGRLPIDASHGKFPGWEVPLEHILRYQAWDESGEPVSGRRPSTRSRLNGYMPRGLGARRPVVRRPIVRRRGVRGLGQDGSGIDDFSDIDINNLAGEAGPSMTGTVGSNLSPATLQSIFQNSLQDLDSNTVDVDMSNFGGQFDTDWNNLVGGGSSSSSGSGSGSSSVGTTISSLTNTLGQIISPQATVIGPNGLAVTGPASTISSIFGGGALASSLTSSSSLTMILLLGGAAIVLFMVMRKK
jgi:hypothetical protein